MNYSKINVQWCTDLNWIVPVSVVFYNVTYTNVIVIAFGYKAKAQDVRYNHIYWNTIRDMAQNDLKCWFATLL